MNSIPINIVSRVVHGLRVSVSYHWCMTFQSRAIYRHIYLYFYKHCAVFSYPFFLQNTSTSLPNSLPLPRPSKEIPEVGSWVGISVMKVDIMSARDPDVTAVDSR